MTPLIQRSVHVFVNTFHFKLIVKFNLTKSRQPIVSSVLRMINKPHDMAAQSV